MIKNALLVGLGGGIGSILRYVLSIIVTVNSFPLATLVVNITGSFFIGCIMGMSARDGSFNESWKLFLATGICGGFTTFSAFSAENVQMLQNGRYALLIVYAATSVLAGIAAAWIGYNLLTN